MPRGSTDARSTVINGPRANSCSLLHDTPKSTIVTDTRNSGPEVIQQILTLAPYLRGPLSPVVSQKDSQLWLGTLNTRTWTLTAGKTYSFPRTGAKEYCNVEGVAILSISKQNGEITAARFAIASEAYNDGGNDDACRETDQSLHIFELPNR